MKIAYVAGKYRAKTKLGIIKNILKARNISKELWKMGYSVICPHMNTALLDGICPDKNFLEGDLEILKFCDVLVLLDNWESSIGTKGEKLFAENNNIIVRQWNKDKEIIKLEAKEKYI